MCKLHKVVYGLRQAPRAWYQELRQFLLHIGFLNSKSDSSLFIFGHPSYVIYLLVYVDDIIVTGSVPKQVQHFILQLSIMFSLKDLGNLSCFLGVEAVHTSSGLFLTQQKYVSDLLVKSKMLDAKEVSTLLNPSDTLQLNDGSASFDATSYRQVLGSLTNSHSLYIGQPLLIMLL